MILDSKGEVAVAFAPTTPHDGTILFPSTYYDEGCPIDLGAGETVGFYIQVGTTCVGATATATFYLLANLADPTFITGNINLFISPAVPVASLVKGYQIQAKVRPGVVARYYTLGVALGTADLSAGAFNAWLINDNFQTAKSTYPAGYSI